jgi:hypothetical protein
MRRFIWMAPTLALAACTPPPATTTTVTTTTTASIPAVQLPPEPVIPVGPPDPNNCGTPTTPEACPPLPRTPLSYYPANR